ncbi:major facilitator superfamily domain-containing protein 6 isoform X3, partial [Lates japonicus]
SAVRRPGLQHGSLPVHLLPAERLDRPAHGGPSRCDPRLSLGSVYLLPERRCAPRPEDVGTGNPAGPPPWPGPRLRSHGGRSVRQLFWCCSDVQRNRHGVPRHPPHLLLNPVA